MQIKFKALIGPINHVTGQANSPDTVVDCTIEIEPQATSAFVLNLIRDVIRHAPEFDALAKSVKQPKEQNT